MISVRMKASLFLTVEMEKGHIQVSYMYKNDDSLSFSTKSSSSANIVISCRPFRVVSQGSSTRFSISQTISASWRWSIAYDFSKCSPQTLHITRLCPISSSMQDSLPAFTTPTLQRYRSKLLTSTTLSTRRAGEKAGAMTLVSHIWFALLYPSPASKTIHLSSWKWTSTSSISFYTLPSTFNNSPNAATYIWACTSSHNAEWIKIVENRGKPLSF